MVGLIDGVLVSGKGVLVDDNGIGCVVSGTRELSRFGTTLLGNVVDRGTTVVLGIGSLRTKETVGMFLVNTWMGVVLQRSVG